MRLPLLSLCLLLGLLLTGSLSAQPLTFNPDNPPTSPTPPTEQYHHFANHTRGPKTLMFIYVRFQNGPMPTVKPFAQFNAEMDNLSQAYYDASYRLTWFGPKRRNGHDVPRLEVTPVVNLNKTSDQYFGSLGMLSSDAIAAVRALGGEYAQGNRLDPANFDRIMIFGTPKPFNSTGIAFLGGSSSWSGDRLDSGVAIHELGHNWGVVHANLWVGDNNISRNSSGTRFEYGDGADVMGGGNTLFNVQMKDQLGFLERAPRNELLTVTSSGTYRLFAHTNPNSRRTETNTRGLHLPVDGMNRWNRSHILGFRFTDAPDGLHTRNSWDRNAVQVHATGIPGSGSHLLDTTPNSREDDDRIDSAIKIGRTFSEGPNVNGTHIYGGVHITPIARGFETHGGVNHQYIDVVVNYGTFPSNQPPVVQFSEAVYSANVGQEVIFSVTATDPDGDPLAYDWDFGNNTYSLVSSPTQTRVYHNPGIYPVRVTVSDMRGGVTEAAAWVNVGNITSLPPSPPASSLSGLSYRYYHGIWTQIPDFDSMLPLKTGTVASLSLAPREQNVNFAFVYDGYLDIPATDIYSFRLTSDDGSRLIISGQTVINNDGLKSSARSASGHVALDAGLHPVRIEFFHRDGFEQLTLRWFSLSFSEQPVPSATFRRADPAGVQAPTVVLTAPLPGSEVLVGSTVQLQAEASDVVGVDRVQFFAGSTFLGQATEAPWIVNWENIPVGPKTIYALAYNVNGAWTISAPLQFVVVSPPPRPSIGINFNPKNEPFGTPSFNEPAGAVYAQPNWNTLTGISANNTGQNRSNPGTEVQDSLGNPSGVVVSWPSIASNDSHITTSNGANPSTGSGKMFRAFLATRDSDYIKPTVHIDQIPYTEYDVYVYFDMPQNNVADTVAMKFTVSPDSGPAPASLFGKNSVSTTNGVGDYDAYDSWVGYKEATATDLNAPLDEILGNYVVFRGLTARNISVEADRGDPAVSANLGISGIQIVSMPPSVPRAVIHTQSTPLELPAGHPAVYAVSLSVAPTENVTVTVQPSAGVVASESSLVFTPANWDEAQTITLHAPSGGGLSLPANLIVNHSVSGTGNYAGAPASSLAIRVLGLHNPPAQNQPPEFTTVPLTAATSGEPYFAAISASDPDGNPLFFSASLLPTWLSLNDHGNGNATLEGVAPRQGVNEYPVILHVSDSKDVATQSFLIRRNSAPEIIAVSPRNAAVDLPELSNILHLDMEVSDDGLPEGSVLTTTWTQLSGPGTASFLDASAASTEVQFSEPGAYRLLLTASDGEAETLRDVQVFVGGDSGESFRANGLRGYWKFDGPANEEPLDSSGQGVTGSLSVNGSASFGPGISGQALRTAADVPDTTRRAKVNLGLLPTFTVSLWFTADESPPPARRYLFAWGRNTNADHRWHVRLNENNSRLRIHSNRSTTSGIWEVDRDVPAGEWVHLVITAENHTPTQVWINGEAVSLSVITEPVGAQNTQSDVLRIGGHRNENQHSWNGLIDEFRVYNRVIDVSEVTLLAVPGPIHRAPAILAGETQSTLPGQDVTLSAMVDAPESEDLELQWTQRDGPGTGSFAGASMAETVFTTTLLPGIYRLRLTAEDQAVRVSGETEVAAAFPPVDDEDLPEVAITAPADGSSFIAGETVTFTGTAVDKDDNDIVATAQWVSSVDGLLGTGASLASSSLAEGLHTIFLTAADAEGNSNSVSIQITILPDPNVNQPPAVTILSPASGSSFVLGTGVTLSASASDPEDGDLSGEVVWTSSLDGSLGSGASLPLTSLSVGTHLITATVADSEGLTDTAQITLTIQPPPPPSITLLSPASGVVALDSTDRVLWLAAEVAGATTVLWSQMEAPVGGTAVLAEPSVAQTPASFTEEGTYLLRITASNAYGSSHADVTVAVGVATGTPEIPANQILYYPLDGNLQDAQGSNHAALTGSGSSTIDGEIGQALRLTSAQTFATSGSGLTLTNAGGMTAAAYVRADSFGSVNRTIFQQTDINGTGRVWLGVNPSGQVYSFIGGDTTTGAAMTQGQWHHVAVTAGGGTVRVYLDGIQVATASLSFENCAGLFRFGNGKNPSNDAQFLGAFDDVRVFNRALTAAEILTLAELKDWTDPGNLLPVIDAGEDFAAETGQSLSLSATALDDEPLTFLWSTLSGPAAAEFSEVGELQPTVSFPLSGTYVLRLLVSDGDATAVDEVTVVVTGEAADQYAAWVAENGLEGSPSDRLDGIPHLLRYALGGTSATPSAALRPVAEISLDQLSLRFQRIADPALHYEVWASSDLVDWGPAPIWSSTGGANVEGETVVQDSVPMGGTPRRFMRLVVWRE